MISAKNLPHKMKWWVMNVLAKSMVFAQRLLTTQNKLLGLIVIWKTVNPISSVDKKENLKQIGNVCYILVLLKF